MQKELKKKDVQIRQLESELIALAREKNDKEHTI